ncbi:MAG: fused MFS/spermidine synthase [Acidimicrobiales bacterium]
MSTRFGAFLVFVTSFCILVLEILAGRLLAPIIGVSLETFTGIIGTILAAIAVGTAAGGRLADRADPAPLVGPTIMAGGASTWVAPLIVSALGPVQAADPASIVFLTAISFFVPAAILSAVNPMVAKLTLEDLGRTGRTVGNLSAAGTAGALAGTFLSGFVFVALFPTRQLITVIGLALVVAGALLTGWGRLAAQKGWLMIGFIVGFGAAVIPSPCDAETAYACVQLESDPDRKGGIAVVLNGTRNSYVDLDDPRYLEFRYMRLFADVTAGLPEGPVDTLHLGGAGFTYPRYLAATRPDSTNLVLEIDEEMVTVAEERLGLVTSPTLAVATGDARLTIRTLPDDAYDLVVGDAFSGLTIPWHLTTDRFVQEIDRVLRPGGVVAANLIDGGGVDFARAELATYAVHFEHVALIVPPDGLDHGEPRNLLLIASNEPLPDIEVDPADGRLLDEEATAELVGDAEVLTDDFAPVDQLRRAR